MGERERKFLRACFASAFHSAPLYNNHGWGNKPRSGLAGGGESAQYRQDSACFSCSGNAEQRGEEADIRILFSLPGTLFWLHKDECSREAEKCQEPEQSLSSGHPNSALGGFFDGKGTLAICPVSRDDWVWLQCPWRDVNACRQTIQVEIMFASINHFYNFS